MGVIKALEGGYVTGEQLVVYLCPSCYLLTPYPRLHQDAAHPTL